MLSVTTTCSCKDHPTRILSGDNNRACQHLQSSEPHYLRGDNTNHNPPEITASFTLPCSSRAIRSASSINRVPKPCGRCVTVSPKSSTSANQDERERRALCTSLPDAGTSSDLVRVQVPLSHRRAAHARCCNLPVQSSLIQGGRYPHLSICADEEGR